MKFKRTQDTYSEIISNFHPVVKEWFEKKYQDFTPPQKYSILNVISRKNSLISSPTGSGKTLSAFLGIINHLMFLSDSNQLENKIYALYISPLKALGNDIEKNLKEPVAELRELAKKHGIDFNPNIDVRSGDTSAYRKSRMNVKAPHILITTPESLSISLASKKFIEKFMGVEWVVIDEIHSLAESKRGTLLMCEIEYLDKINNYELSRIGLSATVSPLEEIAKFLVGYKPRKDEPKECEIIEVDFLKKLDLQVMCPVNNIIEAKHFELENSTYNLINNLIHNHKTTLIFTNTRAGTERVVINMKSRYPNLYNDENIQAHHGSLSKEVRTKVEDDLKEGKLKSVVCSTSLELGMDIGYIDLVILLGSPKSVARALQRIGRSGHKLHEVSKGRIIVQNRDDLVECSVLLKNAIEKKIDFIHIPKNCLDVLAQNIVGNSFRDDYTINDLFYYYKQTYAYHDLKYGEFEDIISYLAGNMGDLQVRSVYPKINLIGEKISKKLGKTRQIYLQNLGTIVQSVGITVKEGERVIGKIEESFLEKLKKGDIFVLGGKTLEFRHAKGTVAQVIESPSRKPTVPRWYSQNLPLSFDLANSILNFRGIIDQMLSLQTKDQIIDYILKNYYLDYNAAHSIYSYFYEQSKVSDNPTDTQIVVEYFKEYGKRYIFFHTVFGRRVNDVFSRAISYLIAHHLHIDFEVGIHDNGFYLMTPNKVNVESFMKYLTSNNIVSLSKESINKSEIYKRRFRQVATRGLMILTQYDGKKKFVGRQQVTSMILVKNIKNFYPNFPLLIETEREILFDLMDLKNAKRIIERIESGKIKIKYNNLDIVSPASFNLMIMSYGDILKYSDRQQFLNNLHKIVLDKINRKQINAKYSTDIHSSIQNNSASSEIDDSELALEQFEDEKIVSTEFYEKLWESEDNSKEQHQIKLKDDFSLAITSLRYKINSLKQKLSKLEREKSPSRLKASGKTRDQINKQIILTQSEIDSMMISDEIISEMIDQINDIELSAESKEFLKNYFQGTVKDFWSDDLVNFFKNKSE